MSSARLLAGVIVLAVVAVTMARLAVFFAEIAAQAGLGRAL